MFYRNLQRIVEQRRTLLGVGPMSTNCIDATIELADKYNVPLMLIASRRQIDSKQFGGGYVNNWSTEEFSRYVFDRDKRGLVILARDHGGPWQNTIEKEEKLGLRKAMESAKDSFRADIDAGLQILHIDPSVDIHSSPKSEDILDRVFELYDFCWTYSKKVGKDILFEIGTEEQSGSTNTMEELDYTLNEVRKFSKKNKIPMPLFVVLQAGTKVMEKRNVGSFDMNIRVENEIAPEIQIPKMIELCNKYGIYMKAHNTDYLSDDALKWYPRLGIHAANIAPEYGVEESIAFLNILEENKLNKLSERFIDISYNSKKWDKWMIEGTSATKRDKAIISGHYVFSAPEFIDLKSEANKILAKREIDLDGYLKEKVKLSIFRYMKNFNLAR